MKKKRVFLCFDLDDTLIAGNRAQVTAYQLAFQKHHLTPVPEQAVLSRFGMAGHVLVKQLYPFLREQEVLEIVHDHNRFLVTQTYRLVKEIPGVVKTLTLLKKRGYVMAVVSNSHQNTLLTLLKAGGIDKKLFSVCVGNNAALRPKPAPDEIHKAEQLVHLKAAYMMGDTIYDILAARRAHVKSIAVLTGHQKRWLLKKYHPYATLKSVADLPSFLAWDMRKTYLRTKKNR